jgi:peptidyl-prolyl cis-trans isomerase C
MPAFEGELVMSTPSMAIARIPCINGMPLCAQDEVLAAEALRQRACIELLRQAAQRAGLLSTEDVATPDGILSEAASQAIEVLLEQALEVQEPDEADCRRHHASQAARYRRGERLRVRHILFAVTPGVDVAALRRQAEATLLEVRCHEQGGDDRFARAARDLSNCPSGADGGALGWLEREACAPEFASELFARSEVGVLPRLVATRFGLHVVEVLERDPGQALAFEAVRAAVATALRQQAYVTALRHYLRRLAAEAEVEGLDLESDAPVLSNA